MSITYLIRCSRKSDCPKAGEKDHWLWSLDKRCVAVISAYPQNMSRNEGGLVCSSKFYCWVGGSEVMINTVNLFV